VSNKYILGHKGNANQNNITIFTSLQSEGLSSILHITNAGKDLGEKEYFHIVDGNVN
jgi:hypothetical protein